ncbi:MULTISPECIES: hypothetical protein [unclassified Microbacterium]|jgi:hypothetical protein|uniref:hypothetical protein n=1 Tax=unclassified Microbacterium TaxID=2609290 RepID=UPI000CFB28EA|nr:MULTISPECIES: hypothetical protein [unclassified Microbacterium]PQZ55334.1 hypothetical protein CQ032_11550 [Microbacterium sp. MYb43]PQZ73965.1 hypothetical protein CQ031_16590 [Microbacterium sp. MYb40]PRB21114.1 hypothetical protein CQ040_09880 [Microbacterium sp. MYb54]PRB26296.1 hypothetical protein CQ037_13315 [Microbacterium sp. MYb50]PRB66935.1 hypothetical protein CQ021_09570 [Microbacterium sp. MYb24]
MRKKMAVLAVPAAAMLGIALLASPGYAAAGGGASPSEAVVVSAVGNTDYVSSIQPMTPYPWGYYATKAKCQAAGKAHMANNPGAFYGYYCVMGTGANRDKWQLYMDEKDCLDRVSPTLTRERLAAV